MSLYRRPVMSRIAFGLDKGEITMFGLQSKNTIRGARSSATPKDQKGSGRLSLSLSHVSSTDSVLAAN